MDDGALLKVTAASLRRAESMCARRLACEFHDQRGNRIAPGRWRVTNQLVEQARLAHIELGPPYAAAFRPLEDLVPEERRVHEAAARWYLALFGERPVRSIELDDWETPVPELGIRLVGQVGLVLESVEGEPELRMLRLGATGAHTSDALASVDARFAMLRHASWVGGRAVRLVHADLLRGECVEHTLDADRALAALRPWLAERVELIRNRAAEPVPRPGLECGSCRFVAGCRAHA